MHLREWIRVHERGDSVLAMVRVFRTSADARVRTISPGTVYAHAREARARIDAHVMRAISAYTQACQCGKCSVVTEDEMEAACARAYGRKQRASKKPSKRVKRSAAA